MSRETVDPDRRKGLYEQVVKWVHNYARSIFLYQQGDLYGVSNAIEWKPRPDEFIFPMEFRGK